VNSKKVVDKDVQTSYCRSHDVIPKERKRVPATATR
jgi:hypothetical protein